MKEILLAIIGSGILSTIVSAIVSARQSKNVLSNGVKQVLYFQIKEGCREAIQDGYIDDDSLHALHEAWEIYHNKLGGNGYLTSLMSKIDHLPMEQRNE